MSSSNVPAPHAQYLDERERNAGSPDCYRDKPCFQALDDLPPPPEDFNELERYEWFRILPDLIANRVVSRADLRLVEAYCQTSASLTKAYTSLRMCEEEEGVTGEPSKWYTVIDRLSRALVGYARVLRLSPDTRSIGLDKEKKVGHHKPADPLGLLDEC